MKRFISLIICCILVLGLMPVDAFAGRPLKRTLTVNNGSGGGQYYAGDEVTIVANTPPEGTVFTEWDNLYGVEFVSGSIYTPESTFIMPSVSFAITAVFEKTYHLEVEGGTGTGDYLPGTEVTIKADEPGKNREFRVWKGAEDVSFAKGNYNKAEAVIIMPAQDITLEAKYKDVLDEGMPVEVKIDGVAVSSGYYLKSGVTSVSEEKPSGDSYAYYSRGVLTLHNYISEDVSGPFITVQEGDLTVKLEGKNIVKKSEEGTGINMAKGDLTITGTSNDSLELNLKDGYGIHCKEQGDITLKCGKIKIKFAENSIRNESTGICTYIGKTVLSGADVDITAEGWGIHAWHRLTITSGKININVSKGKGIEAASGTGTIEITGGDIKINSLKHGIESDSRITIKGGSIEAVSEEKPGISALDFVDILGGKVIGISKAEDECGVMRAVAGSKMKVTVSKNPSGTPVAEYNGNSNDYAYFKAVEKTGMLGDVDGNGKINVLDANLVRRYAAKLISLTEDQIIAADVNGDGRVNILDANLIRRYAAKLIDKFPAEE